MAIKIQNKINLKHIEIISLNDDSLDESSDLEKYKETLDTNHLKFIADKQPTYFVCNFELTGKLAASIKNSMIDGKDEEGNPKISMGSWAHKVVKYVLKDIRNPDYLTEEEKIIFKKDASGFAHDDVIALLERYGIVDEIFTQYTRVAISGVRKNAKN